MSENSTFYWSALTPGLLMDSTTNKREQRRNNECLNWGRWRTCFWRATLDLSFFLICIYRSKLCRAQLLALLATCFYWGRLVGATYRTFYQSKWWFWLGSSVVGGEWSPARLNMVNGYRTVKTPGTSWEVFPEGCLCVVQGKLSAEKKCVQFRSIWSVLLLFLLFLQEKDCSNKGTLWSLQAARKQGFCSRTCWKAKRKTALVLINCNLSSKQSSSPRVLATWDTELGGKKGCVVGECRV